MPLYPRHALLAAAALALTCAGLDAARPQSLETARLFQLSGRDELPGRRCRVFARGCNLDPSLSIEDANAKVYSGFVGYARTLDLWGQSGQIGLLVPGARVDANGLVEGQARSVSRTGFGDGM